MTKAFRLKITHFGQSGACCLTAMWETPHGREPESVFAEGSWNGLVFWFGLVIWRQEARCSFFFFFQKVLRESGAGPSPSLLFNIYFVLDRRSSDDKAMIGKEAAFTPVSQASGPCGLVVQMVLFLTMFRHVTEWFCFHFAPFMIRKKYCLLLIFCEIVYVQQKPMVHLDVTARQLQADSTLFSSGEKEWTRGISN